MLVSKPDTDVSAGLRGPSTLADAPAASAPLSGPALVTETVRVPASAAPRRTVGSLARGVRYRLTVSGTAALGLGVLTDGRCVLVRGAWYRQAALALDFPGAPHGRLFVDGAPFTGRAVTGRTCGSRTHSLDYTATRTDRLALAVWDPLSRTDDTGALTVRVRRLGR